MQNEKPILFNGDMVRAILDGRKTQTRRIIKPQDLIPRDWPTWGKEPQDAVVRHHCPYGTFGTRLWVRETALYWMNASGATLVAAYAANGYEPEDGEKWTPSILMPRWASRITLESTEVRVQRVQEISEEDAIAEGICSACDYKPSADGLDVCRRDNPLVSFCGMDPIEEYAKLWNEMYSAPMPNYARIDGKRRIASYTSYPCENIRETRWHRGKPWEVIGNPWVWAITFKVAEVKR